MTIDQAREEVRKSLPGFLRAACWRTPHLKRCCVGFIDGGVRYALAKGNSWEEAIKNSRLVRTDSARTE